MVLWNAGRRSAKLISVIVSAFTASFVQSWSLFFPTQSLQTLPIFDARTVCYPSDAIMRDYLSWRQADTHINNQASALWLHKAGMTHALKTDVPVSVASLPACAHCQDA